MTTLPQNWIKVQTLSAIHQCWTQNMHCIIIILVSLSGRKHMIFLMCVTGCCTVCAMYHYVLLTPYQPIPRHRNYLQTCAYQYHSVMTVPHKVCTACESAAWQERACGIVKHKEKSLISSCFMTDNNKSVNSQKLSLNVWSLCLSKEPIAVSSNSQQLVRESGWIWWSNHAVTFERRVFNSFQQNPHVANLKNTIKNLMIP